jgi:potassium efflux system protein
MIGRFPRALAAFALASALLIASRAMAESPAPEDPQPPIAARSVTHFDKIEFDLGRAIESAALDLSLAQRRFDSAQKRLDEAAQPNDALREEVAARRRSLSTQQRVIALLGERRERVATARETWSRVQRLGSERVLAGTLEEWGNEASAILSDGIRQKEVKEHRLGELRRELAFTEDRLEQLPPGNPAAPWLRMQVSVLKELVAENERDVASLEEAQVLARELLAELETYEDELTWEERLRSAWEQLRAIWSYPLSGAEEEPITVGKVVSAFTVFIIGWIVASLLSRMLGSRVFPRLRLEEGAAHAFQSLAFYLFLLVAFLTSLRTVDIPLTAFAVVGGALAIGVGFGSQTVVGNFISGLILLIERPIKIRDLIDVDGTYGVVEEIGLRSTRILSGDNVHIIVPNASFLEGKVINWTHNDERVRVSLKVGVAYGSPTRDVERLIRQTVDEHPRVLEEPAPIVLFTDFGDNSLGFETRFWIRMRRVMDRLAIESDVRFRIDELFRESGIVIAFPQRDVHLDSLSPIEVRVVDGPERDEVTKETT